MTLVKHNKNATRGLPTLFESFFSDDFGLFPEFIRTSHMNKGIPAVNTRETSSGYEIEVAAPGMDKNDFVVKLDDNVLTISSEKQTSKKEEDDGYTLKEFSYNSFSRSFTLPDNSDGEKISAKYENGILKLELPKVKDAKKSPKMIEVI